MKQTMKRVTALSCTLLLTLASDGQARSLRSQLDNLFGRNGLELTVTRIRQNRDGDDENGGDGGGGGGGGGGMGSAAHTGVHTTISGTGGGGGGGNGGMGDGGGSDGSGGGNSGGRPHTAHFSSATLATMGLLVQQMAGNAADFPAVSTVPGVTFRYDPRYDVFKRTRQSLGPVFVERPATVGKGKLDVGFSYLMVDFDDLDGDDLDDKRFDDLPHNDCCSEPPSPGDPDFENDTASIRFEKFSLKSHVFSFFATYGLTKDWDVNIVVPIVHTLLDVEAVAEIDNRSDTHFFDEALTQTSQRRRVNDEKTGIGDILLRTKYRILDSGPVRAAGGLSLRLPTGEEDNFQGLGDTIIQPFAAFAADVGPLNVYANAGIDFNAHDFDRSRARYAASLVFPFAEGRVAVFADFIGNSGLKTKTLTVSVPEFGDEPDQVVGFRTESIRTRTDLLDLGIGFKAVLGNSLVAFAQVFLPLNDDGFRSEAIPAVGLEWRF